MHFNRKRRCWCNHVASEQQILFYVHQRRQVREAGNDGGRRITHRPASCHRQAQRESRVHRVGGEAPF